MKKYLQDSTMPDCPKCGNTRVFVLPGDDGARPCPCTAKRMPLQAHFSTVVGRQYASTEIGALIAQNEGQAEMLRRAMRFVSRWKPGSPGIYFHSARTGTGKTLIAAGIANAIPRHSQAIEANTMWNALRSCYDSDEPQSRYMNAFCHVPTLLIDDLGVGNTDKSDEWLLDILNARIERGLLTIVTANHMPTEIPNIAPRTASRLAAHCFPVAFDESKDLRVSMAWGRG